MAFEITVDERVEEALDIETFDVLDFVKGGALPSDTVKFYTDADAGYRLTKLRAKEAERAKKASSSDSLGLADEDDYDYDESEEELEELTERLKNSALIFELRGLAPAAVTALNKKLMATTNYEEGEPNEEYATAFNTTIVAKTIVSVTAPNGAKQEGSWKPERVLELSEVANQGEWSKLFNAAIELNFAHNVFDSAVTVDFS